CRPGEGSRWKISGNEPSVSSIIQKENRFASTTGYMIDPADIQKLLEKKPFEPFRVRMADGNYYDLTNPELVVGMEPDLFIELPKGSWKFLSYPNMTIIESIDIAA